VAKIIFGCQCSSADLAQIKNANAQILAALGQLNVTSAGILSSLQLLLAQGKTQMLNVASLTTSVANNTSVVGSALTLIQGFATSQAALSKQLADAIAANDPVALAAVQDAIDSGVAQLNQSDTDLAAAVAANTPAAPPAAPPASSPV
jgi:hypothetical protein